MVTMTAVFNNMNLEEAEKIIEQIIKPYKENTNIVIKEDTSYWDVHTYLIKETDPNKENTDKDIASILIQHE